MKSIEEPRKINAEYFQLTLTLETFSDDSMGFLHVDVVSDNFSASVTMDVFKDDYEKFLIDMQKMYHALQGEAAIKELYGNQQNLIFRIDDCGHVFVKGALSSQGHNGHEQDITIENDFDQTSLSDFA